MNEDIQLENMDVNIGELSVASEQLPPLPQTQPEYNEDVYYNASSQNSTAEFNTDNSGNVQNYDDSIDWGSLQPVDESGYTTPDTPDFESLTPYDVTAKPASVWDEAAVKMDMGNLTNYRATLGREVMSGKITVEEAQARTFGRHQEILNKYGISEVPEFSFAKFRSDPLRTVIGETAQMLPFYGKGLAEGAKYAAVLGPATAWVRGKQAQVAGAVAGTAVEPGGGTLAGAAGGRTVGTIGGLIEGISNGMLIGTFVTSMDVEGSNLYLDLREKGIEHKTAMVAGLSGGLLDGILETASFGFMTAPIKGAAKKAAAKMLWDGMKKSPVMQKAFKSAVTKCATEYFKRVGMETSTEMIQDVVNNTMTLLAAQADSVDSAKPTAEDWKKIITQTGPQTAAAMLLMGAIGTPLM